MASVYTNAEIRIGTLCPSARTLFASAILIFALAVFYRFMHMDELAGPLCYELDAARMMLSGRLPYYDFYFDEPIVVLFLRSPSVWLAQLFDGLRLCGTSVISPAALALGSYIAVVLLQLSSFALVGSLIVRSNLAPFGQRIFAAGMLGWAVAEFSMGFESGCLQHIFVLLAAPYVILKALRSCGIQSAFSLRLLVGLAAGLAASLSLLYLALMLIVEAAEALAASIPGGAVPAGAVPAATSGNSIAGRVEGLAMLVTALALGSLHFCLNRAALAELQDWIIPLKFVSMWLEQIQYFGFTSCPDRRELIYLLCTVLTVCFGVVTRLPLLRPLAACALGGLVIYLTELQGLSSDLLICTWATTMSLAVIGQNVVEAIGRKQGRDRALVLTLPVVAGVCVIAFSSTFLLQRQFAENARNALGFDDNDVFAPTEMLLQPSTLARGNTAFICSGHKVPAYPIYTFAKRQVTGYFINTEPLLTLINAREHHVVDYQVGKPVDWLKNTGEKLWMRFEESIFREKPIVLLIENGSIEAELKGRGFLKKIEPLYKRVDDVYYYSGQSGATEYNGWNYRYCTYMLR